LASAMAGADANSIAQPMPTAVMSFFMLVSSVFSTPGQ
jgi:hypothetical protein